MTSFERFMLLVGAGALIYDMGYRTGMRDGEPCKCKHSIVEKFEEDIMDKEDSNDRYAAWLDTKKREQRNADIQEKIYIHHQKDARRPSIFDVFKRSGVRKEEPQEEVGKELKPKQSTEEKTYTDEELEEILCNKQVFDTVLSILNFDDRAYNPRFYFDIKKNGYRFRPKPEPEPEKKVEETDDYVITKKPNTK